MRLYDLPRDSKLKMKLTLVKNGDQETEEVITFHHVDGMYSLCTIDSLPEGENTMHLSAVSSWKKDGDYYVLSEDQENDETDLATKDPR